MAAIIHLIGYPGVGKLTVARAIAATVPDDAADRILVVDNHLTGNAVLAVTPRGPDGSVPPRAWELVADVREHVFTALAELTPTTWTLVFTNVLREGDPVLERSGAAMSQLVRRRQATYVPVILRCDADEQRRRVVAPERAERGKWMDPDAVHAHRERWALAEPGGPNQLELDVTTMAPDEAAAIILDHVRALSTR